jgi:hypothetical protein
MLYLIRLHNETDEMCAQRILAQLQRFVDVLGVINGGSDLGSA